MKKFGKIISTLMLVAVMLTTTVVPAFAKTYPPVGPDPDPVGHTHSWTFEGFEWHINAEKRIYNAVGVYECTTCGQKCNVQATVTVTDNECTATITAGKSLDGRSHTETYHFHQWEFKKFEWNTDNGYIAFAIYECTTCGERCGIQATVTRTARGYRASIKAAQALDGVARYDTCNVGLTPVMHPFFPHP